MCALRTLGFHSAVALGLQTSHPLLPGRALSKAECMLLTALHEGRFAFHFQVSQTGKGETQWCLL